MLTLIVGAVHFVYLFIRDFFLMPCGFKMNKETAVKIRMRFFKIYVFTIAIDTVVLGVYYLLHHL